MNRTIAFHFLLSVSAGVALRGATTIASTQATPQQILITVQTDQPGNCLYRASEGTSAGALVPDIDPGLFPGANSDARSGSVVEGRRHYFVLGFRKAEQATNNRWYSRSLQVNTPHWIGVTCGTDPEVSQVVNTSNSPLGNTWSDNYPFDASAAWGYAWPTIQFGDKTQSYIDPVTGFLSKPVTGSDQASEGASPSTPIQPAIAGGGFAQSGWNNPQNGAIVDNAVAISTGTGNPLFVAFSPISVAYSTARLPSWTTLTTETIANVKVRVRGSGTGGASNAAICLTVDGVSCATDQKSITLPPATSSVDYPSGAMSGYFSDWIGTTITIPPATYDMATFSGTVNVAATLVTQLSGHQFNVGAWKPGSHIYIGTAGGCTAGDYTIAAVLSDKQVQLSTAPGTCSGASYTAYNFGLMIFPQASAALSIDGVSYMWNERPMFVNPPSGDSDYCNPTTITDNTGERGWICSFANAAGAISGFFVPENMGKAGSFARHLWSQVVPGNADKSISYAQFPEDQTLFTLLGSYAGGTPSEPSRPLVSYTLARKPGTATQWVILAGEYVPAGVAGCSDPAAYQPYAPADPSAQNCNVVWSNKTRSSQQGTLTDKMLAFDARFDPDYFSGLQLIAVREGYLLLLASTVQDAMAWEVFVDTKHFNVVAMWPSYANYPIRWAGAHSFADTGDAQFAQFATQNLGTVCPVTINGCGPYQLTISAINGSAAGSLGTSASEPGCSGVTDPKVTGLLGFGNGCDEITFSGNDPCDATPSTYEMSHFPVCSWNTSYRALRLSTADGGPQPQQIEVGDTFIDLALGEGNAGGEVFLVVKHISGSTWKVLRNFGLPHGPFLLDDKLSTMRSHSANFTVRMTAGLAAKDCEIYGNFMADPHGTSLQCDATYYPTAHGDHNGEVSVVVHYYQALNKLGYSIRTAPPPFGRQVGKQQTVGKEPNSSAQTGVRFGEVRGGGLTLGAAFDSHPSYRQRAVPETERQWFLDMVRLGTFSTLYTGATITPIAGTLYRVAGFQQSGTANVRFRPLVVWAGRHNLRDASGPGSVLSGGASDHWKYCYALLAGECVMDSTAGQLYVNVPAASTTGSCVAGAYSNEPCAVLASPEIDAVSQVGFLGANANGEFTRSLAVPFRPWFMTNPFANVRVTPDGAGVIFTCDWCGGIRSDLWWSKLPPTPTLDTDVRHTYTPLPVTLPGKAGDQVRIRFGYRDYGSPEQLRCTSRQESCATDSSNAQPFVWLSETQHYAPCDSGCTVEIPAIAGRVVYYVVDRLNGSSLVSSGVQMAAVN